MRPFVKYLLIILIPSLCTVLADTALRPFLRPETEEPQEETAEEPAEPEKPVTSTLSLYMIGDALVQTPNDWDAEREDGTYDWSSQMDGIADIASSYDLAFYNQECILGGDYLGMTSFPHFNCPQSYGEYMVSKGFNLVSVANNHSLDKDAEGCINSHAFWEEQKDAVTSGINMSWEERQAVPVYEKNGITYAFTAWTYDTNGWLPPEGMEYLVNTYRGSEEELLQWVRTADTKADFVIVSMHWGTEYTHQPDEEQLRLAQQLADAGADVIIGNHAHHTQPIQWLNDGKTICFYALGNMLSAQTYEGICTWEELNTGIAASLVMEKTENPDGTVTKQVRDVRADLIFTYNTEVYTHMFSVFYKDLTEEMMPGHEDWYQWHIDNVIHAMDPSIHVGLQ